MPTLCYSAQQLAAGDCATLRALLAAAHAGNVAYKLGGDDALQLQTNSENFADSLQIVDELLCGCNSPWLDLDCDELEQLSYLIELADISAADYQTSPEALQAFMFELDKIVQAGDFIQGQTAGLADFMLAAQLYKFADLTAELPALKRWLAYMTETTEWRQLGCR